MITEAQKAEKCPHCGKTMLAPDAVIALCAKIMAARAELEKARWNWIHGGPHAPNLSDGIDAALKALQ